MKLDSLRIQIHSRVSLPMLLFVVVGVTALALLIGYSVRQIATSSESAATRMAAAGVAADFSLELERVSLRLKTVEGVLGRSPQPVVEEEVAKLTKSIDRMRAVADSGAFASHIDRISGATQSIAVVARDALVARWALNDLAAVVPGGIVDLRSEVRDLEKVLLERGDRAIGDRAILLREEADRVTTMTLDFFASGSLDLFETTRFAISALADRSQDLVTVLGPVRPNEREALRDFERARSRLYRFVTEQGGASERARHASSQFASLVAEVAAAAQDMRQSADRASVASVADIEARSGAIDAWLVVAGLVGLVHAMLTLLWLDRRIINPLDALNESMRRLASGDGAISIAGVERRDEIGAMARSLEIFRDNAAAQERLQREATSAAEQQAAHRVLLDRAVANFRQQVSSVVAEVRRGGATTRTVADALNEAVSASHDHIGESRAAARETSTNMTMVASAADELATSIQQIAEQSMRATDITRSARDIGARSTAKVNDLVAASAKIDDIIRLIRTIAGQINLLSLNAAIEAARAGEAGRGFAVVASEVKALAQATDTATMDITTQVTLIQQATREAAETMRTIEGVLANVGHFSESVAQSVEQQGQATLIIASTTSSAATRAELMTHGFQAVQDTIDQAHGAAADFAKLSRDFTGSAETLADAVDRFLEVAAA